ENDKLMLFCRTESGVQYFSFSEDQGKFWSQIESGNIKSPLSPASIERIPETGDLLLLWNNNYKQGRDGGKRTPYSLAISRDEGKSWQKIKTIESDPAGWYCYTAIEFTDNHVLLGHCAGDTRTNNGLSTTHITRLSLDWIYQDVTSDPRVKSDSEGTVKLDCEDKDAQIRYTLDGTLPTQETGFIYQKPLVVTRMTPLHMQAFAKGKTPSKIVSTQIGSGIYQSAQKLSFEPEEGLVYNFYKGEINQTGKIKELPVVESGVIPQFSISKSSEKENFAFTFDAYIKIPKDGLYTFYLKSNDGSVMYLNDRKLIDNDGAHGVYEKMASTSLRAGMHKIGVNYFQLGGGSLLNVSWQGPGTLKQEIGAEFLFHEDQGFYDAVSWLEKEAHRIIRASMRTMNDGTAAFPPQVGIGYEAFWLRDYAYT
ncbi:MAG: exo-alpha-sialidase, partial [Cyclobacteriaceae bacterium]|nr:exo-alpha-sialidase [Cyclobacteriaceae bacterium]